MPMLKDKYVLLVRGSVKSNRGYYEEYNTDYSFSEELNLEESNSINRLGYEIKINKIYTDCVELLANDDVIILKPNESKDIIAINDVYGSNENFVIDKKILFVTLKEINVDKFKHLSSFIDYSKTIDDLIEKVRCLIKYENTYLAIQNSLKILLFKMENEKFFDSIEKEMLISNKDLIIKLIDNIEKYYLENERILKIVTKNHKLRSPEFVVLKHYLYQLANEYSSYERIPFSHISHLCSLVYWNGDGYYEVDLEEKEMIEFCYLLMRINAKNIEYFENFFIADKLSDALFNINENMFDYKCLLNFNIDVADYYMAMHNRPKARKHYLLASEIAKNNSNLKESAYALQKYFKVNNSFPKHLKNEVNIEKIKEEYKEYENIIIQGINYKPLNVCEVEFDPLFIENYFLVMREVEKEIKKVGDLHIPYQRWELIRNIYKEKYNIDWKNPKEMNPRVMFD